MTLGLRVSAALTVVAVFSLSNNMLAAAKGKEVRTRSGLFDENES